MTCTTIRDQIEVKKQLVKVIGAVDAGLPEAMNVDE
jgi:hypothetical protein